MNKLGYTRVFCICWTAHSSYGQLDTIVFSLKELWTQQLTFCFRMEFQEFLFLCPLKESRLCVISGFHRQTAQNCAILVYHAASSGNLLPMFRVNLSVPSSRITYSVNICVVRDPETKASAESFLLSRLSGQWNGV
jgi:hypothetical protein